MNRSFFLGVLMAALAAGAGCGAGDGEGDAFQGIRAQVRVVPVERGIIEQTLELTGVVEAGRLVNLLPEIPGKVKSVSVKVGDQVVEGQLLAELDLEMARLQQSQARAALRLGQLGVETARKAYQRSLALKERGSLTEQQFEQAEAGLSMAEQQYAQARAAVGLATVSLETGILHAPFDGVVAEVGADEGNYFNPMVISPMGGPQSLVAIADLSSLRVDLQVADQDIARLQQGMGARLFVDVIADLLPPDGIEGRVEGLGSVADAMSRTFPARVVAPNPERLVRAGMHARVRLVLEHKDGALVVPDGAVRVADEVAYVMVIEGDQARRKEVETGIVGDQGTEIIYGLNGDETVIVEGNFGLPDGAPIEVVQ